MNKLQTGLLACIALVVGIYFALTIAPTQNQQAEYLSAYPAPRALPDFALIDQRQQPFTSEQLQGHWTLVFVGYTYCPDLCPLALANITQALHLLKRDKDRVETYFITIDPKRDTQEKLKEYHSNFHPNIHMLWGSDEALKPIMAAYKVFAQKVDDDSMSDYLVDHSTFIYILNKEGEVVDVMPHTTPGDEIFRSINNQLFKKNEAHIESLKAPPHDQQHDG